MKAENWYDGVMGDVARGIKQVWNRFEVQEAGNGNGTTEMDEDDERFKFFTEKVSRTLLISFGGVGRAD